MSRCPKCGSLVVTDKMVYNPTQRETYRKKKCIHCSYRSATVEFDVEENELFQKEWEASLLEEAYNI